MHSCIEAPTREQRWDRRYLDLANFISRWSKDAAQVGAVIVSSQRGRIISVGFNGFPSNIADDIERLADKDTKNQITIHAEQNALLFAGRDAKDCDLYVVGKPVCNTCAILAIQAGIKRVVAASPKPNSDSQWDQRGIIALDLFSEARVSFRPITELQWYPQRCREEVFQTTMLNIVQPELDAQLLS